MKQRKGRTSRVCPPRSPCPIAGTLDIVGDKWSLLVVRDLLFLGKRLYGEFAQSDEGIPTNILADRLKRLEETGLLTKKPYQSNPVRHEYRLTPKGEELFPVLREMIRWADKHVPGTYVPTGFLEKFDQQFAAAPRKPGDRARSAHRTRRPSPAR
jgi:DNA-binding HxlR family transcriptional regulator